MRQPLVLVSERLGGVSPTEEAIESAGAHVHAAPLWTLQEIRQNGHEADVILLGAVEPFGAEALAALPTCRGIVRRGVGYDNIDIAAATRLGIVVANVPDASVEEVSDHALTMLLTIERRAIDLNRAVHEGSWAIDPKAIQALRSGVRRLPELTLGVVGFGRIGQALARKAMPLYGRVVAADPVVDPAVASTQGVELLELDDLLSQSDHVSLHAPLTSENHHMIGATQLRSMRRGGVLVNCARGGLVDEAALTEAIRAQRIAGAGLDATEREPLPADDPLLGTQQIMLTAHTAAWSTTAGPDLAARSVRAAIDLVHGNRPASIVNPRVLDSSALRVPSLSATDSDSQ